MRALTLGAHPLTPRTLSRNRYAYCTLHQALSRYIHIIRTPRTRFNYHLSNSQPRFCIRCSTRVYLYIIILGGVLQRAHNIICAFYNYSRHIVYAVLTDHLLSSAGIKTERGKFFLNFIFCCKSSICLLLLAWDIRPAIYTRNRLFFRLNKRQKIMLAWIIYRFSRFVALSSTSRYFKR